MTNNNTIELVGYGHPDRFADYIGELVLQRNLEQDPKAKVALEVLATRNSISLGGEITSSANIDYTKLVHDAIEFVYGEKWWPNFREVEVLNHIAEQSPELSKNQEDKVVAGDQGVIYGYYDEDRFNNIQWLYKVMEEVRANFEIATDWKLLLNLDSYELSMSVCGDVDHSKVKEFLEANFATLNGNNITYVVNPKGTWLIPGPLADTGVVGRKLMIDTFGAGIPHGGGAFCGKDTSKVDKTGIIIASYLAKDTATFHGISKALVELNYKIGDELPKAYAYVEVDGHEKKIDISSTVNLTLDEYIKIYKLNEEPWSEYVTKGGVISYLRRKDSK